MTDKSEQYVVLLPDGYIVGPYTSYKVAKVAAGRLGSLSVVRKILSAREVYRLRRT